MTTMAPRTTPMPIPALAPDESPGLDEAGFGEGVDGLSVAAVEGTLAVSPGATTAALGFGGKFVAFPGGQVAWAVLEGG